MEILKSLAIIAASASLVACIDTGGKGGDDDTGGADTDSAAGDDTDETDEPMAGPPEWDLAAWTGPYSAVISCAGDVATFQLRTTNWGYPPVSLYLVDTRFAPAWDEEHTMDETDQSMEASGYTVFERELTKVASAGAQSPDSTTLFGCERYVDGAGDESVTIAAAVSDSTGAVSDCVVFGHDPASILDGSGPDGASLPSWLTAANCVNGNP